MKKWILCSSVYLVFLILLLQIQIFSIIFDKISNQETTIDDSQYSNNNQIPQSSHHKFKASEQNVNFAYKFLKLPVWSSSFVPCEDEKSERSCNEIFLAAKIIEHWEQVSKSNKTKGSVWVHITDQLFPDRLSMLYQGLQIAMFQNKDLIVDHSKFLPIELPDSIKDSQKVENCEKAIFGKEFSSFDPFSQVENLVIDEATFPQALYINKNIGKYLYDNFGKNAAYYIGNFLFGNIKIQNDCVSKDVYVVEQKHDNDEKINLTNCGIQNSLQYETINDDMDQKSYACKLHQFISSKGIIQRMGSRFGFWATALKGIPGAFVNQDERKCIEQSNSQAGSLFPFYCAPNKSDVFKLQDFLVPKEQNVLIGEFLDNLLL